MLKLPPLILASASPRRAELLKRMGLEFGVLPSAAEEVQDPHLTALESCQLNAYHKARSVAKKHPDCLVLGADTLVCLGEKCFGKPGDPKEARAMLSALSGQTHEVVTGVCLIFLRAHLQTVFADCSLVTFRSLTPPEIDEYLSEVEVLDKAGAYAIQERGELLVEEFYGSHSNIVGLPIERLERELRAIQERYETWLKLA